ncbi:MAG TPA: cytochrome c3 family protein [Anaerolineales bacterium]
MPQIFHPSTNVISKVSIFGAIFFIAAFAWVLTQIFRSPYATNVDVPIEQPIPFSHDHHVAGLGIDCRYCHSSVEESRFADIPPTHTCMTCHVQIWADSPVLEPVRSSFDTGEPIQWVRVYDLADFVYFDHSIHLTKGVGCETCHGRVDRMPLTWKAHTLYMDWCLECHREPERFVRPRDRVFEMGWEPAQDQLTLGRQLVDEYEIAPAYRLDDCYVCHR